MYKYTLLKGNPDDFSSTVAVAYMKKNFRTNLRHSDRVSKFLQYNWNWDEVTYLVISVVLKTFTTKHSRFKEVAFQFRGDP